MQFLNPIAVLYQAGAAPAADGILKPLKPGGYADSGADIAYALRSLGIPLVTPKPTPNSRRDLDWVFPDTDQGIAMAMASGATVLWANTVLYPTHPLETLAIPIRRIGQSSALAYRFDDKAATHTWLIAQELPVPRSIVLAAHQPWPVVTSLLCQYGLSLPLVAKPLRGRGSQGVICAQTDSAWKYAYDQWDAPRFGPRLLVSEYLMGQEVTVTILPPGLYPAGPQGGATHQTTHWTLPPVKRYDHQNGIIPYSGTVPVIDNSSATTCRTQELDILRAQCASIGEAMNAPGPLRIDARQDASGNYRIFDVNLKPNMTGPSRSHRHGQDSLVLLAAQALGWSYADLVCNLAHQQWDG